MSAQILDGRARAAQIREQVRKTIEDHELHPGLGVILVGSDPASHLYVGLKEKAAAEVGVYFEKHLLPEHTTQSEVLARIERLNHDEAIHGILVQLPLPAHLNTDEVIREMDPVKDVDGFHPSNTVLVPPLVASVVDLLQQSSGAYKGRDAALLVNSKTFGNRLAEGLAQLGVESSICVVGDRDKIDNQRICPQSAKAGILIVGMGRKHSVKPRHVADDAIIIDIGTTRIDDSVYGDVDPSVARKAAYISPVPGGIGPMTIAYLLQNVTECAQLARNLS